MPTRSNIPYTPGSGGKHGASQYTDGADTKLDSVEVLGEQHLAQYVFPGGTSISIATANDHVMEIMAGSTNNVYVRRILVYQSVLATTAAMGQFAIFTLSSAGTGGTAQSNVKMDSSDAAVGATGMALPTVKGTEIGRIWLGSALLAQTAPTAGASTLLFDLSFDQLRGKSLRIAAGTSNGICFKNLTAHTGASVYCNIWISEAPY
jgi:hypothetical protein